MFATCDPLCCDNKDYYELMMAICRLFFSDIYGFLRYTFKHQIFTRTGKRASFCDVVGDNAYIWPRCAKHCHQLKTNADQELNRFTWREFSFRPSAWRAHEGTFRQA